MRRGALTVLAIASLVVPAGCGGEDAPGEPKLTVYLSVPLSGPEAVEGLAVSKGAREALGAAGGEAGGVKVDLIVLDAGPGATVSKPTPEEADPVRAAVNARKATQDSAAIAYIGELDSQTTATSLPITNDAGLLHVSPTADDPELVAPFEGSDEVPPEAQPSGMRTFGTFAELDGDAREIGAEAMALVLDAIDRASDPLSRAAVVEAFLATTARESGLGPYSIDELGRAVPSDAEPS